jgi:hypothetical protein
VIVHPGSALVAVSQTTEAIALDVYGNCEGDLLFGILNTVFSVTSHDSIMRRNLSGSSDA